MRGATRLVPVLLLALACSKQDPALQAKVDSLSTKLDSLTDRVDSLQKNVTNLRKTVEASEGPPEPDPALVYSVPIDGDPFIGPENAKVTVVQGFEFACPFCEKVGPTLKQLEKDYGSDLKVVYKYYVVHDVAVEPGLAACAAHRQGKFSPMLDMIWEKGFGGEDLSPANMQRIARQVGLDMKQYETDVRGEACKAWIVSGQQTLSKLGTSGTPSFYINGRHIAGALPIGAFKSVIDQELAKANAAIQGGVALKDYYTTAVVKNGKPTI